ncbi:class II fructose-bisphosphate aldolase [Lactovum odontotermitis]
MLISSKKMLEKARKENFAVPAPNFFDLDSARSHVKVAEKLNKPVILSFAEAHAKVLPLREAALIGKFLAEEASVPVDLHLDHGQTEDFLKEAIDLGFTSIMIDASYEPLEKNTARSKAMADYAHQRGIYVEAEIGHVSSGERVDFIDESENIYTDVNEAVVFAKETGVDSLAVSIGTTHGEYKGQPQINFELLEELHQKIDLPLVLHGGSSSGDANLKCCAKSGISKINIFTDFCLVGLQAVEKGHPKTYFELKEQANQAMADILEHYYQVFETK